ncbi:ANTAR domain-containing protein [Streptomyces sp. R11]|uniref:ANTAR domain-containing protein n=1 Tax=Streptomyces sp. R11 TaxID=3238625 RepID=A0AB39N119_9ACTN
MSGVADHCVGVLGRGVHADRRRPRGVAGGGRRGPRGRLGAAAGPVRRRALSGQLQLRASGAGLDQDGPDGLPPARVHGADARPRYRHDVRGPAAPPDRLLGALNVFGADRTGGSPSEHGTTLRLARLLADCAALGLENNTTYVQCRTLAGQLQQAQSSRVRIEQAKGMLAERRHTPADHAFVAMRQYARRRRLPLDRIAQEVMERVADGAGRRRARTAKDARSTPANFL